MWKVLQQEGPGPEDSRARRGCVGDGGGCSGVCSETLTWDRDWRRPCSRWEPVGRGGGRQGLGEVAPPVWAPWGCTRKEVAGAGGSRRDDAWDLWV